MAAEPGVKEGDMAVSGRTVLQIIDPSRFKLEVDIDETDIPQVVVGQTAIVELDARPLETNGQVQTRRVTVGVSDGLDTEIVQGLAVGENVVIPKQVSESSTSLFGGG